MTYKQYIADRGGKYREYSLDELIELKAADDLIKLIDQKIYDIRNNHITGYGYSVPTSPEMKKFLDWYRERMFNECIRGFISDARRKLLYSDEFKPPKSPDDLPIWKPQQYETPKPSDVITGKPFDNKKLKERDDISILQYVSDALKWNDVTVDMSIKHLRKDITSYGDTWRRFVEGPRTLTLTIKENNMARED